MQIAHRSGMAYQEMATWAPQPGTSLQEYTSMFEIMAKERNAELAKAVVCFKSLDHCMRLSCVVDDAQRPAKHVCGRYTQTCATQLAGRNWSKSHMAE